MNEKVLTTNHQELIEHVITAAKAKIAVMIHGPPGIGKSDTINEVAEILANGATVVERADPGDDEYGFLDIRASMMEPSDVLGVPFNNEGYTRYCPPENLPRSGRGILFLDEVTLAAPSVQAALYQLILDRKVGNYTLPEGWVVIAASNREQDGAHMYPMAKPLQNRFGQHIELEEPVIIHANGETKGTWTEWAGKHGVDNQIVSFLLWKQDLLFKFDKNSKDYAYPTPRSWYFLSQLLKNVETDDYEKIGNYAIGCVGEQTGALFKSFLKHKKSLNLNKIWKNPESINELENHESLYAAASSIAEIGAREKDKFPLAIAVSLAVNNKELGVYLSVLMKSIMTAEAFVKGIRDANTSKRKIGQEWCTKYREVITGMDND